MMVIYLIYLLLLLLRCGFVNHREGSFFGAWRLGKVVWLWMELCVTVSMLLA